MQCPACSHPEMEEKNQDETLSYSGQSVTVQNLRGEFCPVCGEGVWDSESNRRLDEAQTALMNAVRAERVPISDALESRCSLRKQNWPISICLEK